MIRMTLLLTALLLSAGALGRAQQSWTPPFPLDETVWYRITLLGQPSGYMSSAARLVTPESGPARLEVLERQVVKVSLGGDPLRLSSQVVSLYDEDLGLQQVQLVLDKLGVEQRVEAYREGDLLRVVNTEHGRTETELLPLPPDFGSELQVFTRLVRGELAVGESLTLTVFNPLVAALDVETFTVLEPEPLDPLQEGPAAVPVSIHSAALGLDMRVWLDAEGRVARFSLPLLLGAMGERVSPQEALASLSPLVLDNAVPLDQPLPPSSRLSRVVLTARSPLTDPAGLVPTTARQLVTAEGERQARVEILGQPLPVAQHALPVTDPELAAYLQSTPLAPIQEPALADLARSIVGSQTDAWRAAQTLCDWVYRRLGKMESEPRPLGALQVLEEGRGDCSEHSILMAALARAAGLPARVVTGLAWAQDAFYYHAWVEVYVGEWVEMDPTWGQTRVSAGHLRLAASGLDAVSFARMSLETGRTMGALHLRLVEHETYH